MSEDNNIGTVTTRGLLTASRTAGHSTVTVSDVRNPAHYDTMEVFIIDLAIYTSIAYIIISLPTAKSLVNR